MGETMLPLTETTIPIADPGRGVRARRVAIARAVDDVIDSGRFIHGPEHDAFESEFAVFLEVDHCAAVASGTDALQLSLAAVGCRPGDDVVVAANAGGYAAAAARRIGLVPRYADVDRETLGVSAATVDAAQTPATRAVVVTHLFGLVGDVAEIVSLCRERGIAVVEDCGQAAGARSKGRRAGSFGDAAAFSFYPTKNLACLGDGGAVVTSDPGVAERVSALRQYGWKEKYRIAMAGGWNSRLDELQAAILRVELTGLDERNARRRAIVERYAHALSPAAGRFVFREGEAYAAHLAVIDAVDRDRVRAALEGAAISTDVHYPIADHRQPAWAGDYAGVSLPVTDRAVEHVLTVPCFPELTDEEIARVSEVLGGL